MKQRSANMQLSRVGFGVDLGRRLLKTILLEDSAEGTAVCAAGAVPVPAGCFAKDAVSDRKRLAAVLKSLCSSQGIRPLRGRFSVPSASLSVRWLDLPRVAEEDLHGVATFQAKRYFAGAGANGYASLIPMIAGEGDTMTYLLVSAPRDVVDSRAIVLETAGIEPTGADIEPFCVLRALQGLFSHSGVFWRNQSLTFIEMGAVTTQMYVVRDMCLRFIRTIQFGGRDLALKLAEDLGVSEQDASLLLEAPGATLSQEGALRVPAGGSGDVASSASTSHEVPGVFAALVKEVHRLLTYYRSLFPERSYAGILDRVYLSGGMASLTGLAPYLAGTLGVHVHTVNPFAQVVSKFNVNAFESVSHREHAFTGAIGLASADLDDAPATSGDEMGGSSEFVWTKAS